MRRGAYPGPPSYRDGHPRWGFPPVVWRTATVSDADVETAAPPRALRGNALLAGVTALVCLVAAGAEIWRYGLMLRGRTWVLSGAQVRASDALLAWSAGLALLLGIATAVWAVPNLIALHRGSAVRNGSAPSRSGAAVVSRLVIPGWNVYGAGQVLAEIDSELAIAAGAGAVPGGRHPSVSGAPASATPRPSVLVLAWWASWALNAVLVVITLASAFWRSTQALANTVEWHIAVDLVAAAVAGLFAAVLIRFERRWTGRIDSGLTGWMVAPPASTASNRRTVHPADPTSSPVGTGEASAQAGAEIALGAAATPTSEGESPSETKSEDGPGDRLEPGTVQERTDREDHGVGEALDRPVD